MYIHVKMQPSQRNMMDIVFDFAREPCRRLEQIAPGSERDVMSVGGGVDVTPL